MPSHGSWPYGDLYVLEKLWERLEIGKKLRGILKEGNRRAPLERTLFVMAANRCIAPYRYAYEAGGRSV
jgi:hypothetical protein